MKILYDETKVKNNVAKIKEYLKGLRFRNAKSGLYIYGRYTTYFISKIDLEEYHQDSLMFIQQLIDTIYEKELLRGV